MSLLDWSVLTGTLLFIVIYGVWKVRGNNSMQSYLRGDNESSWWTIGLGVMATQASAITFMSTPGQAFHDGMGFVQFYFGLPLAMVIISITFIPIYHRLKVYTAYQFLEDRFDLKTRTLAALLFLIQRGLAAGITIYAPAIILSTILGWNLNLLNFIIGALVVIYTVSGGVKAVSVTQKQQMFVIMAGMFFAFYVIVRSFPANVGMSNALHIAGAGEKLNILDFSFNPESRYTFWSGITGGLFLALSYFGTDQSQVGRYLHGKSIKESQMGLIMNGLLKVPMQFFILLVGVMIFVFYQFNPSPVFFNQPVLDKLENTTAVNELHRLNQKNDSIFILKSQIASSLASQTNDATQNKFKALLVEEKNIRNEAKQLIARELPNEETNDKDYVFISFILKHLPEGLIGLLMAVIFSAAMSSTSSELSALASTTCVDLYQRNVRRPRSDIHYVKMTKWLTVLWGAIAIAFASFGTLFENLIQFVNIIGSIFYGTILGIFLIAFYIKYVKGNAVFIGALLSEIIVIGIYLSDVVGYLWLNAIGCLLTIIFSVIIQYFYHQKANQS